MPPILGHSSSRSSLLLVVAHKFEIVSRLHGSIEVGLHFTTFLCSSCPVLGFTGPSSTQKAKMSDARSDIDEQTLAPLLGVVDRLQAEVAELEMQWKTLEWMLETKRRSLRLAEATVERMQRRQEEAAQQEEGGAGGGVVLRAGEEELISQVSQASLGSHSSPFRQTVRNVT
jgi:hypothetical protein